MGFSFSDHMNTLHDSVINQPEAKGRDNSSVKDTDTGSTFYD